MCASMTPTYRYSPIVSSSMSLDQNHIQPSSSSSYPPYYDPHHHQPLNRLQTYHQHMITDAEKIAINPSGRSWNKEDKNDQVKEGSTKWMPSKMRMMMMVPDQTMNRFEDHNQKQPLLSSPLTHYNNNTCNISSCSSDQTYDIGVRVCADCHTTKTPLWRSGPTGPKSLCNACGIRQRKARRAMAAVAAVVSAPVRENEVQKKQEKEALLKKKMKACGGRKKVVLEDLAIRLSKNLSEQQVLFPQDEKEAAILLMALSYGLVRG